MTVTEDTWTKVTPQRICSMAFCPLQDKLVVAAGDKRGVLGLWDVSLADAGVHQLAAHNRHINGLSFAPHDGHQCFTTSYDGITRRLDLQKMELDQVYATAGSEDLYLIHHAHVGAAGLLIGRSDGQLVRVDLRSSDSVLHRVGSGDVRYISVHPSREHTVVTVERPSTISLWDMRRLKGERSALQRVELPRACSSASISRRAGDALVALSSDDTIRLYSDLNSGDMLPTKTIRHNNHTGRWLTTFKPTWLPDSDDLFLVGSMDRPRRMEVYDRAGPVYHYLMGEELQSVCSTIVCHPTQPAIAGGNSSGRVYVFQ
ncbi:WD repeat-containing protein 76-like [Pollicipes pollicipes]|uniref:WD repeat-containing protein 76-like n=1 Tax=Pollicipes pollicipes TaxID=41117 RepID=UPI001884AC42|nr:WD repeat-containing protein 76-like [Pollicipes pollicipes]